MTAWPRAATIKIFKNFIHFERELLSGSRKPLYNDLKQKLLELKQCSFPISPPMSQLHYCYLIPWTNIPGDFPLLSYTRENSERNLIQYDILENTLMNNCSNFTVFTFHHFLFKSAIKLLKFRQNTSILTSLVMLSKFLLYCFFLKFLFLRVLFCLIPFFYPPPFLSKYDSSQFFVWN